MTAPKTTTLYGLLLKLEASYLAGGTLVAGTDGILIREPIELMTAFLFGGDHGPMSGSAGRWKNAVPRGENVQFAFSVEGRGRNAAYGAAAFSNDLHAALRIAGHSATLDSTGGAEKFTFAPLSLQSSWVSGVAEGYGRGELWKFKGLYADLGFTIDGPAFMIFNFPVFGVYDSGPSDTALPAITHQSHQPPTGVGTAISIGAYTAVARRIEFQKNQQFSARGDVATPGHQGWTPGKRDPKLIVTFEQPLIASYNPKADHRAGTPRAISFVHGSALYNRIKFDAANAMVEEIATEQDGDTALLRVTYGLKLSDPTLNDDYVITLT